MGDLKISGNSVAWPEKPTLIKPIPIRAQAKVPKGASSSFQSWQNYPSLHNLATIPENGTHFMEENTTNVGAALVYANDQNTVNHARANIENEREKKIRRMMSNRDSAQRSRLKKIAYMEELENRISYYKEHIGLLNHQLESQQHDWRMMQIQHHELKFQMAALERKRILQEVEIEKKKAEVHRLRELQRRTTAEAKARRILNLRSLGLMTNSNLHPSAFAGLGRRN